MNCYCLAGFLPGFSQSGFIAVCCLLSCPVYCFGMCICIPMFGLVCCFPLYCCDTTPHSRTGISINLTWKAASLCLFARVPSGVHSVPDQGDSHRWHRLPPLQLCVRFTLGPSAQTEHPWTTAVTPWEKRPVAPAANWSALSKTIGIKKYWWQYNPLILYYVYYSFFFASVTILTPVKKILTKSCGIGRKYVFKKASSAPWRQNISFWLVYK